MYDDNYDGWGGRRFRDKVTGKTVIHFSTSYGSGGTTYKLIDCTTIECIKIPEETFKKNYEIIKLPESPKGDQILHHIKENYPGLYMSAMRFLTPGYFEVGNLVYLTEPINGKDFSWWVYGPEHPFVISRIRSLDRYEDEMKITYEVEIVHKDVYQKEAGHTPYACFQYSRINRNSRDAFEMLRRYDKDF